jgi:serine/threonine protein phosphatase PrpC
MDIKDALEIISLTHPGMVRAHNEDSVASDAACGLVVLADGMGGYNAGEVASGIAVSVVSTEIKHYLESARPEDKDVESGEEVAVMLLRSNVQKANSSIFHAAHSQPQYAGMGTTWLWHISAIRACTGCAEKFSNASHAIIPCFRSR